MVITNHKTGRGHVYHIFVVKNKYVVVIRKYYNIILQYVKLETINILVFKVVTAEHGWKLSKTFK